MRSSCCQLTQLCSLNKDFINIIRVLSHESRSQKFAPPPEIFRICTPDAKKVELEYLADL